MEERNDGMDPRQHERLCAWLFDEMAADERAAFEAEMAADPALQAERDRLERTVGLVRELALDAPTLAADRHDRLAQSVPGRRTGFVRFAAAAAVIASVGGGVYWWAVCNPAPTPTVREDLAHGEVRYDRLESEARLRDRLAVRDEADQDGGDRAAAKSREAATAEEPVLADAEVQTVAPDPRVSPADTAVAEREVQRTQQHLWAALGQPVAEESKAQQQGQNRAFVGVLQGADPGGKESAFDSNAWNSAIGLGGAPRGAVTVAPDATVTENSGTAGGQGGQYRGPSDVMPPKPAQDSAASEFFMGAGVDTRTLNELLDDEQSEEDRSVVLRLFADTDSDEQANFYYQNRFDPDAFFRACQPRPNERPRDMYFRFWGDNAYVLTRSDALATFAADVDTASYVLARRYLRDGVLPEKAQIRTEEFVNYFDPDLAPPAEGDFAIHTELAPSPFGGSNARYLLRVGIRAREIPIEQREPLALTFVVDTSGSMREDRRLELVKHALMTLVSKLDAGDRIGIIAFSNEARLVLPMTPADQTAVIAAVVQGLQPGGSTNAEAGLKLGYELAATALDPERLSRVVFLSDGVANVGQTDQDRIAEDVRERRESGILLNTIGVGMDNHNDVFLEQLADQGDGVCDYVDDARAVHRAIVERFTGAFQPVAADVKIQVEFADGRVLRWRQIGYENRAVADQDFRNDAVDAGEVGSGHQVTALFELETALTPDAVEAADDVDWATVRVRWMPPRRAGDDPSAREAQEMEQRVDASDFVADFAKASPGFRRAALVAQFAEVLRRSTHAMGDSYAALEQGVQELSRDPAFATDDDTVELVSLVQRAAELGIANELHRTDLARACDEYKRHRYLRHQLGQVEDGLRREELDDLRRQNDLLEQRIRDLARGR